MSQPRLSPNPSSSDAKRSTTPTEIKISPDVLTACGVDAQEFEARRKTLKHLRDTASERLSNVRYEAGVLVAEYKLRLTANGEIKASLGADDFIEYTKKLYAPFEAVKRDAIKYHEKLAQFSQSLNEGYVAHYQPLDQLRKNIIAFLFAEAKKQFDLIRQRAADEKATNDSIKLLVDNYNKQFAEIAMIDLATEKTEIRTILKTPKFNPERLTLSSRLNSKFETSLALDSIIFELQIRLTDLYIKTPAPLRNAFEAFSEENAAMLHIQRNDEIARSAEMIVKFKPNFWTSMEWIQNNQKKLEGIDATNSDLKSDADYVKHFQPLNKLRNDIIEFLKREAFNLFNFIIKQISQEEVTNSQVKQMIARYNKEFKNIAKIDFIEKALQIGKISPNRLTFVFQLDELEKSLSLPTVLPQLQVLLVEFYANVSVPMRAVFQDFVTKTPELLEIAVKDAKADKPLIAVKPSDSTRASLNWIQSNTASFESLSKEIQCTAAVHDITNSDHNFEQALAKFKKAFAAKKAYLDERAKLGRKVLDRFVTAFKKSGEKVRKADAKKYRTNTLPAIITKEAAYQGIAQTLLLARSMDTQVAEIANNVAALPKMDRLLKLNLPAESKKLAANAQNDFDPGDKKRSSTTTATAALLEQKNEELAAKLKVAALSKETEQAVITQLKLLKTNAAAACPDEFIQACAKYDAALKIMQAHPDLEPDRLMRRLPQPQDRINAALHLALRNIDLDAKDIDVTQIHKALTGKVTPVLFNLQNAVEEMTGISELRENEKQRQQAIADTTARLDIITKEAKGNVTPEMTALERTLNQTRRIVIWDDNREKNWETQYDRWLNAEDFKNLDYSRESLKETLAQFKSKLFSNDEKKQAFNGFYIKETLEKIDGLLKETKTGIAQLKHVSVTPSAIGGTYTGYLKLELVKKELATLLLNLAETYANLIVKPLVLKQGSEAVKAATEFNNLFQGIASFAINITKNDPDIVSKTVGRLAFTKPVDICKHTLPVLLDILNNLQLQAPYAKERLFTAVKESPLLCEHLLLNTKPIITAVPDDKDKQGLSTYRKPPKVYDWQELVKLTFKPATQVLIDQIEGLKHIRELSPLTTECRSKLNDLRELLYRADASGKVLAENIRILLVDRVVIDMFKEKALELYNSLVPILKNHAAQPGAYTLRRLKQIIEKDPNIAKKEDRLALEGSSKPYRRICAAILTAIDAFTANPEGGEEVNLLKNALAELRIGTKKTTQPTAMSSHRK